MNLPQYCKRVALFFSLALLFSSHGHTHLHSGQMGMPLQQVLCDVALSPSQLCAMIDEQSETEHVTKMLIRFKNAKNRWVTHPISVDEYSTWWTQHKYDVQAFEPSNLFTLEHEFLASIYLYAKHPYSKHEMLIQEIQIFKSNFYRLFLRSKQESRWIYFTKKKA